MSRKALLTPALAEKIVELYQGGLFRSSVARLVGIEPSTIIRWIERGKREKSGIYYDLTTKITDIELQIEGTLTRSLIEAALKGSSAAFEYLKRRFPGWSEHAALEPIFNCESMSLSDKAILLTNLMFKGEIPPEQARTAASALFTVTQVIEQDELAKIIRRLHEDALPYLGDFSDV